MLRILIADDDEGIRLLIKKVIDKVEGFELVGEAGDGANALHLAEKLHPDIIFLDIEMPELTGVECAKRIMDIYPKTFFIFATAHEEYMSEAFEIYAADYLVKPFKVERVIQTLKRIKETVKAQEWEPLRLIAQKEKSLKKLLIKNKESMSLIDVGEIILVQREERSTVVYTQNERYITSESLSDLEDRLDKSMFFRSHKSYIINLSKVYKIYPYGRWTFIIKLKNIDKDALITHEKYEELQKLFED